MTSQWNSLFSPSKTEKAVENRKSNDNRNRSSIDPRWPPGRKRKWKRKPLEMGIDSEGGSPGGIETGNRFRKSSNSFLEWIIFLILIVSARAICPSKCDCDDKLLKAICVNSNLEVVPIQLNPEIKFLKLNKNKIGNVHLTFIFYTNLIELDLSENKIKSLGSKNFEFQLNLIKLNASRNSIRDLHRDAFKGLRELAILDLSGNRIEEINDRSSFRDLRRLRELDLSKNNIYSLESGVFDQLIELERLILSENQITRIPENGIGSLGNLIEIDLNSNLIEDLFFSSANLPNLEVLRLRSNLIGFVSNETFDRIPRLRRLDLSDNNLTRIPNFQFSKLTRLEYLNLSSNTFHSIESNSFRNLHGLREIVIDGGISLYRIDPEAFSENRNLNYVSLSNNRNLKRIPKFLFFDKPNLKHLRISGNDFSTLDASDLPLDQLETLTLGRNPFVCNCSLHWLWILKERQTMRNCTCSTENSCFESCAENFPKSEKLSADYGSEEEEEENWTDSRSESEEREKEDGNEEEENGEEEREKNSRFRSFNYEKDFFPIILDLDEIYCEGGRNDERIPLKESPKSDFDCGATWMVVLTAATLSIIFVFLATAFVYVLTIRLRKRRKDPVERFAAQVATAKRYEDPRRTYYGCGEKTVRNGDLFDILDPSCRREKSCHVKAPTNVYIKSPLDRTFNNYGRDYGRGGFSTKSLENPRQIDYVTDSNVYQEPFASSPVLKIKSQRHPHVVYV